MEDESLTKWFFEHGARPNLCSADSSFPAKPGLCLNSAASKSSVAVFDMLLDHDAEREISIPLHMAAGAGSSGERIPMMIHLVNLGFDVNGSDEIRGRYAIGTPLQYAIKAGSIEKVKYLLQNGADPHKSIGLAGSPYKMAERTASKEIFELLKQFS